jgi:hypothetical protein
MKRTKGLLLLVIGFMMSTSNFAQTNKDKIPIQVYPVPSPAHSIKSTADLLYLQITDEDTKIPLPSTIIVFHFETLRQLSSTVEEVLKKGIGIGGFRIPPFSYALKTRSDGKSSIYLLKKGFYTFWIEPPEGYYPLLLQIYIKKPSKKVFKEILQTRKGNTLTVYIKDSDGKPLRNVILSLADIKDCPLYNDYQHQQSYMWGGIQPDEEKIKEGVLLKTLYPLGKLEAGISFPSYYLYISDKHGKIMINPVCDGKFIFALYLPRYNFILTKQVEVKGDTFVEFSLPKGSPVDIQVKLPDGKPAQYSGVEIRICWIMGKKVKPHGWRGRVVWYYITLTADKNGRLKVWLDKNNKNWRYSFYAEYLIEGNMYEGSAEFSADKLPAEVKIKLRRKEEKAPKLGIIEVRRKGRKDKVKCKGE